MRHAFVVQPSQPPFLPALPLNCIRRPHQGLRDAAPQRRRLHRLAPEVRDNLGVPAGADTSVTRRHELRGGCCAALCCAVGAVLCRAMHAVQGATLLPCDVPVMLCKISPLPLHSSPSPAGSASLDLT